MGEKRIPSAAASLDEPGALEARRSPGGAPEAGAPKQPRRPLDVSDTVEVAAVVLARRNSLLRTI